MVDTVSISMVQYLCQLILNSFGRYNMVIYKSLLKEILYEIEHRDEIMAKKNLTCYMYYAYMTGKMTPVIRWILTADKIIIEE